MDINNQVLATNRLNILAIVGIILGFYYLYEFIKNTGYKNPVFFIILYILYYINISIMTLIGR